MDQSCKNLFLSIIFLIEKLNQVTKTISEILVKCFCGKIEIFIRENFWSPEVRYFSYGNFIPEILWYLIRALAVFLMTGNLLFLAYILAFIICFPYFLFRLSYKSENANNIPLYISFNIWYLLWLKMHKRRKRVFLKITSYNCNNEFIPHHFCNFN